MKRSTIARRNRDRRQCSNSHAMNVHKNFSQRWPMWRVPESGSHGSLLNPRNLCRGGRVAVETCAASVCSKGYLSLSAFQAHDPRLRWANESGLGATVDTRRAHCVTCICRHTPYIAFFSSSSRWQFHPSKRQRARNSSNGIIAECPFNERGI